MRILILAMLAAPAAAVTLPFEFGFPEEPPYDTRRGYGFEAGAVFSVQVPEGNYRVTLSVRPEHRNSRVTLLAEQRRFMSEALMLNGTQPAERSFIVNVRTAELGPLPENATGGTAVRLKPREIGSRSWDDRLSVQLLGEARLRSLRIERVELPTLYLAGDSTVTDQPVAPGASWGQMLPRLFNPDIAIANHAESGETLKSFVTGMRLDKLLSGVRSGDWVMIQFGHNDQKQQWPQTYADAASTYRSWLRTYIAEVRRRGGVPVLVGSPERRNFDSAGRIVPSLADYAEAARAVAREERVAFVDLNAMSRVFYEALGPESAAKAFADGGRDRTHFNEYGADALARMVVEGLRAADPTLTAGLQTHIAAGTKRFDPAHPSLPPD